VTPTPYWSDDSVTLYQGDTLAVLREMPDACVDAVIADPPYSSGGAFRGDRTLRSSADKYVRTGAQLAGPAFTGDNRDQRSYGYWSALWLGEALRLARPGALCVIWTDWRQLPTVTDAVQAGGWVWRGILPWVKPAHRSRPVRGGFWNQSEFGVWASAGPMRKDYLECLPGVVHAASPHASDRVHITEKPRDLFDLCAQAAPPGGTILDPFAGGGTMLAAGRAMGRRVIAVELDPAYCATIVDRLARDDRRGDQLAMDAP
jgi:site-specific DNA-methyltransferase (adenine-specific)